MISRVVSGGLAGIEAYLTQVEVDISSGLPGFTLVGLLGSEVREARERVQVALKNAGFSQPPRKITVNLAPADVRKEGTAYDLAIALGVLSSLGYFPETAMQGILFVGELGLDGEIKPVKGVLPIVKKAAEQGLGICVVPLENAPEGASIPEMEVRGAKNLCQIVQFLQCSGSQRDTILPVEERKYFSQEAYAGPDFSEVKGQEGAKRAALIAAAGFHNLLLVGPPGTGKSMIARRLAGILPPLTEEESLEVTAIYSVAGLLGKYQSLIRSRPYLAPHHTATQAAILGGGSPPRPGEISLAHRGVLFLDELPEFSRTVLESLRQPMEDKQIHISRVFGKVRYPADFMLVGAMNPCACGYYPDKNRCRCTENELYRYRSRISGPILDRMDLCVEVLPMEFASLGKTPGTGSSEMRSLVRGARRMQEERYQAKNRFNGDISGKETEAFCALGTREKHLMEQVYRTMGLSVRGYYRILRVARTIADLAGEEKIGEEHLMEAVCYRMTDGFLREDEPANREPPTFQEKSVVKERGEGENV